MSTSIDTPADTPRVDDHPERRILRDLMEVGVYVNSVQDLVDSAAHFGRARRILVHHREHGGHAEDVRAMIEQALERSDRPDIRVS